METETGHAPVREKADFLSGVAFVVLGLVVFYLSYTMPRLEARNIHPSTIPGLVPMAIGATLVLLGGLLAFKARRGAVASWGRFFAMFGTIEARRVLAALALVLVFVLGLVGRMPFWAAAMIFMFAFIITMEVLLAHKPLQKPDAWRNAILWGAVTAVGAGAGIYYLFSELLLVRLP